ncbi:MAG: alanine racemase [Rhodospirillales bacterium]
MTQPEYCGAILTVDLDAIAENYKLLRGTFTGAECAAVVKADAYGLGARMVAPALAKAGCKTFFVAHLQEAIDLRAILPEAGIHVLNGLAPGTGAVFAEHRLVPVLNSLGDLEAWKGFLESQSFKDVPPADIHLDSGMLRLGLPPGEIDTLANEPERLAGINLTAVLSHLACATELDHPLNPRHLKAFKQDLAKLPATPGTRVSFCGSSAIFLGPDYHFDLARPGAALYGINPLPGRPNPMRQTVRLQGKILQVRDVDTPQTVGYGATHRVTRKGKIATVAVGYADGFFRALSNRGCGYIGDIRVPIVGRVSMDLITVDVGDVPSSQLFTGALVELLGPDRDPDAVAEDAGTIGYEVLTALGSRYHRAYVGGTD